MTEEQILDQIADRGQLSRAEYLYITNFIRDKSFLVFGTGKDTPYWKLINPNTVFLENKKEWLDASDPNQYLVHYRTKRHQSNALLSSYRAGVTVGLLMDIPEEVRTRKWDVIFVDSPEGYGQNTPGRMQSIYAASQLASPTTDVFVHDIDRSVENQWTSTVFSKVIKFIVRTMHVRL